MQVSFNLRITYEIGGQRYSEELRFKSAVDRDNFVEGVPTFDINFNLKVSTQWEDYVGLSAAEARVEMRRALVNKVTK